MPSRASDSAIPDLRLFRTIFEQSPVSTQVFRPDGLTVDVNPAWEALWGTSLEQLGPYNILQDAQLVEKGIMPLIVRAFAGEAVDIPAFQYVPEESVPDVTQVHYRWVESSAYPVKDMAGNVAAVVLMHQDITAQREMQMAVQASEAIFRSVFESAPVGIALIDEDNRYVAVNPVRADMLGYSEAELLGRSYLEVTHPDDVDMDRQVNREARAQGRDQFQFEKRFLRKGGENHWARMTVARVPGTDPVRWISITEDITAWKRADEEREALLARVRHAFSDTAAAERMLNTVVEQLPFGVAVTDREGCVVLLNEAGRQIAGLPPSGDIPLTDQALAYLIRHSTSGQPIGPDDTPIARVLRGEQVLNDETVFRPPDGGEDVWVRTSGVPLPDVDGEIAGAVVTFQDVTGFHQLEQQKTEFLSAIAHDLRTPLTSIKGRAQIVDRRLGRSEPDIEQARLDVRRIEIAAGKIMTLVTNLLDVANIELGRAVALSLRRTDLVALARAAVEQYAVVSDRHTIRIQSAIDRCMGEWDPDRLERVVANLLSNALKYSPLGGEIVVEVREERDGDRALAVLSVSDPGIGIHADDLTHIFGRFTRGANVNSGMSGAGIGLAVVKEIIEQHGGTVTAESREGIGTTFTVQLPMETATETM